MKRILWGKNQVRKALESGVTPDVVILDASSPDKELRAMLAPTKFGRLPVYERPRAELDAVSKGGTHEGVLMISGNFTYSDLDLEVLPKAKSPTTLVCLDEVTDLGNVGSILRTAAAFGVDGVVVTKDRSAPINGVVVRVSMAATELVRVARVTNLARTLDALGRDGEFTVVGLDASAEQSLDQVDLTGNVAIVMGSEGEGLRRLVRERCTHLAKIPMAPPLDSLNVATATAIALYECQRQRAK
ncbi:MAG: 23S rRNA (guanosine(2251)-2'-O)-methyltransferase RlmB [Myxococcales bacterium]|nr:23S rRNA (guanosine(2251)-2'-O)-methyltransferase RlmB [Myxococcales bacterium]